MRVPRGWLAVARLPTKGRNDDTSSSADCFDHTGSAEYSDHGGAPAAGLVLADPVTAATILVPPSGPECVFVAARDLAGDTERTTGKRPRVARNTKEAGNHRVDIVSADRPESAELLRIGCVPLP